MAAPSEPPPPAPAAPTAPYGGRNPRTVRLIVIVLALVVILGGITIWYFVTRSTACTITSTNPLIFDQPEKPDTLDPQVTFSTPGWGITQQIYQTLVMYNGSSYTTFLPVLAQSWTESTDHMNFTFRLRQGIHFSNGDPFNAYVMWYSLNRALVMNQDPQFILSQNFWYPNVTYYSNPAEIDASIAKLTTDLNTFNFRNPTASQLATMKDANQSFQVIDNRTIELRLGAGYLGTPYTYILATLSAPIAAAVNPFVIAANGGVSNATNSWMSSNMLGTGPYTLSTYTPTTGFTLAPDPNYWGMAAGTAEPWNNIVQPAKSSIQLNFQSDPAKTTQDLTSGAVAGASFAYLGPSTVNALKGSPCVIVKPLDAVYSSTAGAWWIYMNQNVEPFNNRSFRAAIAHAINYDQIIARAFGGNAIRWVGPVPPAYPYHNPEQSSRAPVPYQYNLTLARQFMNDTPWPGGYPTSPAAPPIKYAYVNLGDWAEVAVLLQSDLARIGIRIEPKPISLPNLYEEQARDANGVCTTATPANGGPFSMGQEFYTSDYIAPDDWTQNNAYSEGSANDCMSQYTNATMDKLVFDAAAETDPATLTAMYAQMTRLMYDNYTNVWLVSPTQFAVYNPFLQGVVPNPMGSALPFTMTFNTEYALKP